MTLSRVKLGDLIEQVDERNFDNFFDETNLKGLSTSKILIPSKADTTDLDLKGYKILRNNWFSYCTVTSRNGNRISIAYNDGDDCIISAINPVFKIINIDILIPRYLMMFFNRPEFDRYSRYNSWGSARETFTWEDFCEIELDLPPIDVQKKYVAIYEGLLANLHSYEKRLDDLKLVCDGYIEDLKNNCEKRSLKTILKRRNERNDDINAVYWGIGSEGFIKPMQELSEGNILHKKKFYIDDFIFTPSGVNIHNKTIECGVCSHVNEMFYCEEENILSDYIEIWLKREEFYRYCSFFNISSVMSNFNYDTFNGYSIPIPSLEIQKSIISIYNCLKKYKNIISSLKAHISNICPILNKGSLGIKDE